MLTCDNCGAPLHDAMRPVTCPFCGAENRDEPVKVVPTTVTQVVAAPGAQLRLCPECQLPLASVCVEDVTLDGCADCGGIWLDNDAAKKVLASTAPVFSKIAWDAARAAPRASARRNATPKCPDCARPLADAVFLEFDLDICREHGTWFDPFELSKVVIAVREQRAKEGATEVTCSACGARVPSSTTSVTSSGVVCDACFVASKTKEAATIARSGPVETGLHALLKARGPTFPR